MKIVVADDLPVSALNLLNTEGWTVDARTGRTAEALAGDLADADVIVINTCGFIDVAKEESVDAILDAVRLKQDGRVRAVVDQQKTSEYYEQSEGYVSTWAGGEAKDD